METRYRLPPKLVRVRAGLGPFYEKLISRSLKSFNRARLQRGFNETFCKMADSPTWKGLCEEVFDHYVGQFSFTPLAQIHLLAESLHVTAQTLVLELAAGTGGLSVYLAKLTGCRLTGVDVCPMAVGIGNRRARLQDMAEHVRFQFGLLPELQYPENSFDVVVSIEGVSIVPDKTSLFRNCYRVLRPCGHLGFFTVYRLKEFSAKNAMHARASSRFTLQSYPRLLEEVGFTGISKIDLTKDFIQLANEWVEAMQNQRAVLDKELGKKVTRGLLADIGTICLLANEGYLGRAFFKAEKPQYKGACTLPTDSCAAWKLMQGPGALRKDARIHVNLLKIMFGVTLDSQNK